MVLSSAPTATTIIYLNLTRKPGAAFDMGQWRAVAARPSRTARGAPSRV
jgi:hypothetical protein